MTINQQFADILDLEPQKVYNYTPYLDLVLESVALRTIEFATDGITDIILELESSQPINHFLGDFSNYPILTVLPIGSTSEDIVDEVSQNIISDEPTAVIGVVSATIEGKQYDIVFLQ